MIQRQMKAEEMHLDPDHPVHRGLMDLVMDIWDGECPERILHAPTQPGNVEQVIEWICMNPPPPNWCGVRMLPIQGRSHWTFLVADYRGLPTDLYVLIPPAPRHRLMFPLNSAAVIISPSRLSPDDPLNVTKKRVQVVGQQRVHILPTVVSYPPYMLGHSLTARSV